MISGIHAGHEVGDNSSPLFVGVINLSPESFYKGSVTTSTTRLENKIDEMHKYDVGCIDVGGMSTRPLTLYDGKKATIKHELERIEKFLPSVIDIAKSYDIPVSIDTQHSKVAETAIKMGVSVINDISGLNTDPDMVKLIADYDVDLVLMATRNEPGDVCGINETIKYLDKSVQKAIDGGIDKSRIVVDPAFGGWQGRGSDCDLKLIKNFEQIRSLGYPIYVGVSRKSTINTLKGGKSPDDRLTGSVVLTNWLIERGAHVIRTHDVKETVLGFNVFQSLSSISS